MTFPIELSPTIKLGTVNITRTVTLRDGLTVLIGPNGSGKTHLMRGIKQALPRHVNPKKIRFLSAGRVGIFEQYRSDYDGHRNGNPPYDAANFGGIGDTERRHVNETLQGDFQTLAARPDILTKIRERLRKLFHRDVYVIWDNGRLKVNFVGTSGDFSEYSAGREASGLIHLAGLLAALYDDDVGAVLIDEPEVSLHPQLQAFLLREILEVAGYPNESNNKKIVIIGTHSTEFIPVNALDDLTRLVFCYNINNDPIQIPSDAAELQSKKLRGLINRMGLEHKRSFFAKSPLLVEGPSDAIICRGLANKYMIHIEAGGSQILPVIGKGQFPIVVKLMRILGKEPLVLTDADGIADGLDLAHCFLANDSADTIASSKGFGSAIELSRSIHSDFSQLVADHWDSIESHATSHPYWTQRDSEKDDAIAKRRAALSTLFVMTDHDLTSLVPAGSWSSIQQRLLVLFDILETQGCFILRRGTIESYYQHTTRETTSDKPSNAAEEAEEFETSSLNIETNYQDVLRFLQAAASNENINEAESIQDMVLAVAAPALGRVKQGVPASSLNELARSIIGRNADMFALNVLDGKLQIDLKSNILDVPGFPLLLDPNDDVVKAVASGLELT